MTNSLKLLANNLGRLMRERDIGKKKLSEATSISRTLLDKYLDGTTAPTIDTLDSLAEFFKVSAASLVTDPTKPEKLSLIEAWELVGDALKQLQRSGASDPSESSNIPDDILSWSASEAHPEDWENIREYIKIGKEHRQRVEAGEQNNHARSKLTATSTFEERVLDRVRKLDQVDQKDLEDWLDRLLTKRKEKKKAKDAS